MSATSIPGRPFKHYACTPTRELPGNRIRLGAPRRLIVRAMQDRAVHFVGNPAAVDHETRVADPAAAAAFWVWTQSGTPFAGLDPCCGCGVPTPMQCPCTRSWFCSLCTSHRSLMSTAQVDAASVYVRCRLPLVFASLLPSHSWNQLYVPISWRARFDMLISVFVAVWWCVIICSLCRSLLFRSVLAS